MNKLFYGDQKRKWVTGTAKMSLLRHFIYLQYTEWPINLKTLKYLENQPLYPKNSW